ncbi:MAG TPA: TetR family transcriptional regulator C-terminal domain-containing protein, partial [Acidimicrobiales bacterium]|nr:TetR family transcriptional regulator C-terminal domain-containing protein [Acidimicrobiales bacterium]
DLVTAAIAADPGALPPLPELIRTATESTTGSGDDGAQHFAIYVALWLASADDPDLAADLHDSDAELIDAYAGLYDQAARAYRLEWIPPFGPQLFATMVAALTDGLTVRASSQGDITSRHLLRRVEGGHDVPWSVLASGVFALVEAFTRPRSDPDAGSSRNGD